MSSNPNFEGIEDRYRFGPDLLGVDAEFLEERGFGVEIEAAAGTEGGWWGRVGEGSGGCCGGGGGGVEGDEGDGCCGGKVRVCGERGELGVGLVAALVVWWLGGVGGRGGRGGAGAGAGGEDHRRDLGHFWGLGFGDWISGGDDRESGENLKRLIGSREM